MKIGPQMFGRIVVCPQCGKRIEVPFESDPKAEALYYFMKQQRAGEKATEQAVRKGPLTEPDEFDRWIDEFWMSVPDHHIEGNAVPPPWKPAESEQAQSALAPLWNRQTRWLFRLLLVVVFLLGCFGGFILHFLFVSGRAGGRETSAVPETATSSQNIRVEGELSYRNSEGARMPDADAVVLFLPLDRIPAIPISSHGLVPNDVRFDPDGEASQQIKELGGVFQRTGADGSFAFPLRDEGRYLALTISSHLHRDEQGLSPATIRDLQRFFRDPHELLGDYCYAREEYDVKPGTYLIRQTFGN